MLTALPNTRQNDGESKRVWYFSPSLDMFMWFDTDHAPYAFDLTYKFQRHTQRTVSWHRDRGYRHCRVEEGNGRFGSGYMLVQVAAFDSTLVAAQFLAQCVDLPAAISNYVLVKLAAFELPASHTLTPRQPARRSTDASRAARAEIEPT